MCRIVKLSRRCYSVAATANEAISRLDTKKLPSKVTEFVNRWARVCNPKRIEICDGSEAENIRLLQYLMKHGMTKPLLQYSNCWLTRTDPADVARVESKTFISTSSKRTTVPETVPGVPSMLGNWMSPSDMETALSNRFPGCMKGRTMYVIPFSMGPIGGPLSKIGVEITDSPYVVASMRIMTRMGDPVWESMVTRHGGTEDFVGCVHSVGKPIPFRSPLIANWPCDPQRTIIAHLPERNQICSYGSGYGGNSLLGKKCLALRLGSILGRREGWLAEHMLIMGITHPSGKKRYFAAAFPSACGKTNLAMLQPTLPGYKIECVGDDIAWMRFDSKGQLRAINPENGFFGVAPGTSHKTNPIAMDLIQEDTMFTNVAETSDGGFFWEGLEKEMPPGVDITDWRYKAWTPGSTRTAAHPNSRFCSPATNLSILDHAFEESEGVPIDAIIFGGRRPKGVPLVYEAFNWEHGVFIGSSMRSEATAAAEHKGKVILHDPFAMRPFFGYNFGDYLKHWLEFPRLNPFPKMPRIFHVNWFRKADGGGFLWPGFGENIRVIDWMFRRLDNDDSVKQYSPIGYIPKPGSINTEGMEETIDWEHLLSVPHVHWVDEMEKVRVFYNEQIGSDLPPQIEHELTAQQHRFKQWVQEE